jgi:hypothetical protein
MLAIAFVLAFPAPRELPLERSAGDGEHGTLRPEDERLLDQLELILELELLEQLDLEDPDELAGEGPP